MNGLLRDTLAEMVSRKIFVLFVIVTMVLLLAVWGTWEVRLNISGDQGFSDAASGAAASLVAEAFAKVMSVLVFFAVFATAGLLPRSLERGRAEFFLSKPLSRAQLLTARLVSIWLVYGLMVVACGMIVYVVMVMAHGGFDPAMIYLFAMTLVEYGVWVSIVGLAGILFGSSSWAMIIAFSVWVAQLLLASHDTFRNLLTNQVILYTIDTLYYLVPKTSQMRDLAVNLAVGQPVESWLPLWSSVVVAAILYYCAISVFARRDY